MGERVGRASATPARAVLGDYPSFCWLGVRFLDEPFPTWHHQISWKLMSIGVTVFFVMRVAARS